MAEEIRFSKQIGLLFLDHLWSGMGEGTATCCQEDMNGLIGIWALVEATSPTSTAEAVGQDPRLATHG